MGREGEGRDSGEGCWGDVGIVGLARLGRRGRRDVMGRSSDGGAGRGCWGVQGRKGLSDVAGWPDGEDRGCSTWQGEAPQQG